MNKNQQIQNDLKKRKKTHNGIYSDVGTILEKYSIKDLFKYYLDVVMKGNDGCLRDFFEQSIITDEINKLNSMY